MTEMDIGYNAIPDRVPDTVSDTLSDTVYLEQNNTIQEQTEQDLQTSPAYQEIRNVYLEVFPGKPKPRKSTRSYLKKAETRMKDAYFAANWEKALRRAARSDLCHESGWFDMTFFLENELNWEKCLNGKYDNQKKSRGTGPAPPTQRIISTEDAS